MNKSELLISLMFFLIRQIEKKISVHKEIWYVTTNTLKFKLNLNALFESQNLVSSFDLIWWTMNMQIKNFFCQIWTKRSRTQKRTNRKIITNNWEIFSRHINAICFFRFKHSHHYVFFVENIYFFILKQVNAWANYLIIEIWKSLRFFTKRFRY